MSTTGILTVMSDVKGTEVYIDDGFRGLTDLNITLISGGYMVKVVKQDGGCFEDTVSVSAGETPEVDASVDTGLRDGKRYQKNLVGGKEMVFIPSGTFTMGSNEGDSDEKDPHPVTVGSFWMDVTEVTNAEYKEFLDATEYDGSGEADGDYLNDWSGRNYPSGKGNHPVVWISWNNARAYCRWAEKRLPTEAEWEYAAGGPEHYKWSLGETFDSSKYSFSQDSSEQVGSYDANGYGLYDMSGSVWEWVSSLYKDYPYSSDDRREDLDASWDRVLRGGSWLSTGTGNLRTANRYRNDPGYTDSYFGIRCLQ